MTTEPGRLDKPSRALAALHHDLDTLAETVEVLRRYVGDLERIGTSRAVSGDRVAVTRSGHEQGMRPVRFGRMVTEVDPETGEQVERWVPGDEVEQGELWASEGWPLARRIFRDVCRRTDRVRVDLVGCESLVLNFLNAGMTPGRDVRRELAVEHEEFAHLLEAQRERTKRNETEQRLPGQTQPKWHGR